MRCRICLLYIAKQTYVKNKFSEYPDIACGTSDCLLLLAPDTASRRALLKLRCDPSIRGWRKPDDARRLGPEPPRTWCYPESSTEVPSEAPPIFHGERHSCKPRRFQGPVQERAQATAAQTRFAPRDLPFLRV